MLYILILVIIISIAIYKTNIITSNYLSNSENFKSNNYSLLNERGISIDVKLNKEYILATGEIDTPYHNIGKAIDNITTIPLELMLTNGSITNLELLEKGRVDFALCQEDILYDMALGLNRFNNKKLNNIRFVTSLYDELFYLIVPKTSNINNFQVLKNGFSIKGENYIIGTSSDGSGSLEILKMMCNLFSIELVKVELDQIIKNTDKNVLYYIDKNINTNCNLLINNKIDGIFYVTGPKTSYVVNLSQVLPIKFISLYDEQFDILNKLSGNKYKKGNIKIQEDSINTIENRDVPTQSVRSVLVCRKDLDETLVYNFTKEIYKNIDYVKNFMVNQNSIFSNLGVLGTENIVESNNWVKNNTSSFIETYTDSYSKNFVPLEMYYINKHIKYHKGSYKLYTEFNYINVENNKQAKACDSSFDNTKCNLIPFLDKKNYYWRYERIPGLEAKFER